MARVASPLQIRHTVARDGVRVAYTVLEGRAPPVIHVGAPASTPLPMAHLQPQSGAFFGGVSQGRRQVFFDYRGTGASGPIGDDLTIDDQVLDVEAVTDVVQGDVDAVAWNTGCFAAGLFAARNPRRWRSLVLVNPAVSGDGYLSKHIVAAMDARREALTHDGAAPPEAFVRALMLRQVWDVPEDQTMHLAELWVTLVPRRSFDLHHQAFAGLDLSPVLPGIDIPVHVIASSGAWEFACSRVAELLPNATATILPSHVYINGTAGSAIGQAMRRFWGNLGRGGDAASRDLPPDASAHVAGPPLSRRESEVLRLIARGQSNAEIAETLGTSVRTVERHTANIYGKLRVHNRVAATGWALRNGLG